MQVRKTYVEFFYPGAIVSETSVKEVSSADPNEVEVPEYAFGFRFFERVEYTTDEGVLLKSDPRDHTRMYYPEGRVFTKEEVLAEVTDSWDILLNMKVNRWTHVVRTRFGNFVPFMEGDVVL